MDPNTSTINPETAPVAPVPAGTDISKERREAMMAVAIAVQKLLKIDDYKYANIVKQAGIAAFGSELSGEALREAVANAD